MNINLSDAIQAAKTKHSSGDKRTDQGGNDDRGDSFLKSLNQFLEKKRISDKKLEDKSQDLDKRIEKDEPKDQAKDLSHYLNTNYLIDFQPEEKTLKGGLDIQPIGDILIGDGKGLEDLMEENFNPDSLVKEVEAQVLGLKGHETIDPLLAKDLDEADLAQVNRLNFSIEEAKANLTKALNKEVSSLERDQVVLGQEDTKEAPLKGELLDRVGQVAKAKDLDSPQAIGEVKEPGPTNTNNSLLETRALEETTEKAIDPLDLETAKPGKEDKAMDKNTVEVVENSTNMETKHIDSNIFFNRIQNSILGFEESSDSLSTENIQNIGDSMIEFMEVSKEGDASVMRVRLYPEELGSIDISLKLDKGKLMADIIVASDKIKEMFVNSSSTLNRNLIEQNLPIKDINIRLDDPFTNLENANSQAGDGDSRGHRGQAKEARSTRGELATSPIEDMRKDSINRRNMPSEGLNILV